MWVYHTSTLVVLSARLAYTPAIAIRPLDHVAGPHRSMQHMGICWRQLAFHASLTPTCAEPAAQFVSADARMRRQCMAPIMPQPHELLPVVSHTLLRTLPPRVHHPHLH
jgi:hypothetical protein